MDNFDKLDKQIEITKDCIEEEAYRNNFVKNATIIILENQLVIMEILKSLLKIA